MINQTRMGTLGVWILLGVLSGPIGYAEELTSLTLLHTNDLHSHFRPDGSALRLGGLGRIKTAVDAIRSAEPNTLLVDGGDWSEGQIYYKLEAGTETLRMMDHLTYDAIVVGNHDWINGPGHLLDAYDRANPRFPLLGANFDASRYERREHFEKTIIPYSIQERGGIKTAFIGVGTYELLYDRWFKPIKIKPIFDPIRKAVKELKGKVDLIVVISHNSIKVNAQILKVIPEVDLVVGAHDHVRLTEPVIVKRPGHSDGWVVETGCWGRHLGRVDLLFSRDPGEARFKLNRKQYRLIQMDSRIPEDSETLRRIERLESVLENRYGPIFSDHVADNHIEVLRKGQESLMGNLVTDAYLAATGADIALDQIAMIYGELYPGPIHSADVFNANPAIYNPDTDRAWTLKTLDLSGKNLAWILNLLYSTRQLAQLGVMSTSGMRVTFDPVNRPAAGLGDDSDTDFSASFREPFFTPVVKEVLIQGQPINLKRNYKVAAGGGIVIAMETLNSLVPNTIPLDSLKDTNVEDWITLKEHLKKITPVTGDKIPVGTRVRTEQPDLGAFSHHLSWQVLDSSAAGLRLKISMTVTNYGQTRSPEGAKLAITTLKNGTEIGVSPQPVQLASARTLPSLRYLETAHLNWETFLPRYDDFGALIATIEGADGFDINPSNQKVTRWVDMDSQVGSTSDFAANSLLGSVAMPGASSARGLKLPR